MASIKDNLVTKLIGFEEGVNIRTLDQVTNTIRPRFTPISKPKISFTENSERKYSVVLNVKKIPTDPGDGNYTLKIESPKGSNKDIIIRAVGENKSKSTFSITSNLNNVSQIEGKAFTIVNDRKFLNVNSTARLVFQDNSVGTITLRSGTASVPIQVISSGNATARAADFAAKVNNSQNNGIYNLITAEARANIVFLTQTALGDQGNTVISKANLANIEVPDNFSNGNQNNSSINFTFSKNYDRPTRVSSRNWLIGVSSVTSDSADAVANRLAAAEAAYKALKEASDQGELQYTVSDRDNLSVALESKFNGANRNHTPFGSAIDNQMISLPSFTGGSLGALASENSGNKRHPRDSSMYGLGLKNPPSYYASGDDGTRYREVLDSDSQKIKRVVFDINNIINYHSADSAISSKIIGDDTLFITHEPYAGYSQASPNPSDGKKVFQNGLSDNSFYEFGKSNWKITSSINNSNHFRDDIEFENIFEKEPKKIEIYLENPELISRDGIRHDTSKKYMSFYFDIEPSFNITEKDFNNLPTFVIDVSVSSEITPNTGVNFSVINREQVQYGGGLKVNKMITIYPFNNLDTIPLDVQGRTARDVFFMALREAFEYCSLPIKIGVNELEQKLIIQESEKLTRFQLSMTSTQDRFLDAQSSSYLSVSDTVVADYIKYGFTFYSPGKTVRVNFNPEIDYPRGPMAEKINDIYSPGDLVPIFEVGTKGLENGEDLKNRISHALEVASRKSYLNEIDTQLNVPHVSFFYPENLDLDNLNTNLFGSFLDFRFLVGERQYLDIGFYFTNGGADGLGMPSTGAVLQNGHIIKPDGTRVQNEKPPRAYYNVKINRSDGKKEVLENLRRAIIVALSGKEVDFLITHVGSDRGTGENNPEAVQHMGFKLYFKDPYVTNFNPDRDVNTISIVRSENGRNFLPSHDITLDCDANLGNNTMRIFSPDDQIFSIQQTKAYENLLRTGTFSNKFEYNLSDFANPDGSTSNKVSVNFRDGEKPYYYLSPNHDVEIMSFGFGDQRNQLAHYEDLTVHGRVFEQGFQNFKNTSFLDPVFYIESSSEIRFPIRLKNIGSYLGFEMDGVIEPLEIRELLLGRTITESPTRDTKGALIGSYSYCPRRKSSSLITNKINYEKSSTAPFFDSVITKGNLMEFPPSLIPSGIYSDEGDIFISNFYFHYQGIIFRNEEKVFPFIDVEEKIQHNNILSGNNPEELSLDPIVSNLNRFSTDILSIVDDSSLGIENFRKTSGFQFSSNPHPGSDSFVFGGLRYV